MNFTNQEDNSNQQASYISTVAFRVHNMEAMTAFYSEAFGVSFETVQTGDFTSQFGKLDGITLKFVPIRDESEFEEYPIHQLGITVPDLKRVIELALRHGGRIENEIQVSDGLSIAAVRDPDGNTIELYSNAD